MSDMTLLVRTFERFEALTAHARQKLLSIPIREITLPNHCADLRFGQDLPVLLDGFACRFKQLRNGDRAILALFLPGDLCGVERLLLSPDGHRGHGICAMTPSRFAVLPKEPLLELVEGDPLLLRSILRWSLQEQAIAREWLVNVGRRPALARIAHFFCEISMRQHQLQRGMELTCELPLNQSQIAQALALTSVHVNRTLMQLRRPGLITFRKPRLVIHDLAALRAIADFDPAYLNSIQPTAPLALDLLKARGPAAPGIERLAPSPAAVSLSGSDQSVLRSAMPRSTEDASGQRGSQRPP
jgi:CRP-like cAMP-binding protein